MRRAPGTVAPGRAETRDLVLDDRDLQGRLPLQEIVGRPQARIAGTENRHVDVHGTA